MLNNVPPLIHVLGQTPTQEDRNKAQANAVIIQMSSALYIHVVSNRITTQDYAIETELDKEHLQSLARACRDAAMAYYVGLGLIQVKEPEADAESK